MSVIDICMGLFLIRFNAVGSCKGHWSCMAIRARHNDECLSWVSRYRYNAMVNHASPTNGFLGGFLTYNQPGPSFINLFVQDSQRELPPLRALWGEAPGRDSNPGRADLVAGTLDHRTWVFCRSL